MGSFCLHPASWGIFPLFRKIDGLPTVCVCVLCNCWVLAIIFSDHIQILLATNSWDCWKLWKIVENWRELFRLIDWNSWRPPGESSASISISPVLCFTCKLILLNGPSSITGINRFVGIRTYLDGITVTLNWILLVIFFLVLMLQNFSSSSLTLRQNGEFVSCNSNSYSCRSLLFEKCK
jgi:hypothetical protein